ncbi:DUF4367 domain-containing protein [Virgibacillus sp. C22-A2]|uniref:DUF4367 domain-containing protein n=1 Tax=Virgibacillus tibetensis TaxID=3042313 RepID=A0ABU6KI46_9BACI|nr:DUF4367 domain-containing protein [Virgibacillus sp. C22-A2]
MDEIEKRLSKTDRKRKFLTSLIVGFILLGTIIYLIKLPVNMAGWFVPFKVEIPTNIPLDIESEYAKVVGFDRVKIIYESPEESVTFWATSKIGWNNVSSWDESITLADGTPAYYNERDNIQMLSWRMDKVEYAIDYKGKQPLSKDELIKVASSLE